MREVTVTEAGYAYIFVSNENPEQVDVHFDDVKVTHIHSNIVAGADYYPFGLAMDGREIDDESYRWGYQGQFSEENETTGWNEFKLRNYEPRLGRWTSPDPYGQFASSYLGMGNAPHMGVDPDGGFWGMGPIVSGAVIGAGVGFVGGAIYGLANDKDNWGWYALAGAGGGAALGALGGAIYKASTYDIPGLGRIGKNPSNPIQRATLSKTIDMGDVTTPTFDQQVAKEIIVGFGKKVRRVRFTDESIPYGAPNRPTTVSRKDKPVTSYSGGDFPSDRMIKNKGSFGEKIVRYKVRVTEQLAPRGEDVFGLPLEDQSIFQVRQYKVRLTIDVRMRQSAISIHRMSGWR